MTALRINESSGSMGSLQVSDGFGGFLSGSIIPGNNITVGNDLEGNFTISSEIDPNSVTIGDPEDSTYTDGLFTDFNSTTRLGIAIDRFNEVLKGLAPSSAPNLDDINTTNSGVSAKLSFGSSQSITGYENVSSSTLTPGSTFSDIDINGTFGQSSSSNNLRAGIFQGSTTIAGTLNADVPSDLPNYSAGSFGNADQGYLRLYLNDNSTPIHETDLSTFSSGNSLNANGSGFVLSVVTDGSFSNGTSFPTFKHRTGTYVINPADQIDGWNYARVTHVIGSTETTTNYIEWVNDSNLDQISTNGNFFDNLSMTGQKYLSGVKYFTGGSAEYRTRVHNAYKNIYSTSNITFTSSNCSLSSQSIPSINYPLENENKVLHITGSATISTSILLNQSISTGINVPHPFKQITNSGNLSIDGILLYNISDSATGIYEPFRGESFRIKSGNYNTQSDVTDAQNSWDSTESLLLNDGMLFFNQRLYAPIQGIDSGDFRNTQDGGIIANGPSGNVNYETIISGERTFYRKFQNTSGGSKSNFAVTINGSGTIISHSDSYTSSAVKVFIKLPTTSNQFSTGWMDLSVPFATGQTGDGDGCLVGTFDSSLNSVNNATFGIESAGSNEYIVLAIKTDSSFTGYIDSISISWS